jgi:hypothetical protein
VIQNDYELQIKYYEKEIEAANTDIYQWSPMVTEKQAEIFSSGTDGHQHWYNTFYPYKMWHDASERKKAALQNIKDISDKVAKEAAEAEAAAEAAEAKRAAKRIRTVPESNDKLDDGTSIPTTVDIEKLSTDSKLDD